MTTPDADGRTPLHVAAGCEQVCSQHVSSSCSVYHGSDMSADTQEEVVQWLLDQDIDVDAVDKRGRTALHYAVGGKEVYIHSITSLPLQNLVILSLRRCIKSSAPCWCKQVHHQRLLTGLARHR